MLHLALILADAHKLLAKNALVFIDQILRGKAAPTDLHQNFSKTAQSEMKHLMKCFLKSILSVLLDVSILFPEAIH